MCIRDRILEGQIKNVCDWYPSMSANQVADIASSTFGYVNMARYDVGCLSFLEFAMAGCNCFCWDFHPMFDEYQNVHRFMNSEHAVKTITDQASEGLSRNQALREEMIDLHSFESFREQLSQLTIEVNNAN